MHQIQALVEVGVDEIILAIAYNAERMKKDMDEQLNELQLKDKVKITYSEEDPKKPLGTAGPLALARYHLTADGNETFFVLNADVICEYPFNKMIEYHKQKGGDGTILVTRVDDPSKYGVVVSREDGLIEKFVEKPSIPISYNINAGIYILEKKVLDLISPKPTSIEREIFPLMASNEVLYSMELPGYWMDVGQPKDYLKGLCLYMTHPKETLRHPSDVTNITIKDGVDIHPSAKIGAGCIIGPNVSIGHDVVIDENVQIERSSIMSGSKIGANSSIHSSIIGWESVIGQSCKIENNTILGEDVKVSDGKKLFGAIVCPNKEIKEDILEEGKIIL